jgi:hypothetical protein
MNINIEKLFTSMAALHRFADAAPVSGQGVKVTYPKMASQVRRGDNWKSRSIFLGMTVILLIFVSHTYADDSLSGEEKALNQKIAEMETLITTMEAETDGWKLRSSMQEHARIMEESVRLASMMADASSGDSDSCTELVEAREGIMVCEDPDDIRNSQYRLLVVLLRHVVYRQNIIMEKTGIFK